MNPKALYWMDLETTGLDPQEDQLLEMAIARAPFNNPFEITIIGNWTFSFKNWENVDPYIIEMHSKSGLIVDCIRSTLLDSPSWTTRRDELCDLMESALAPFHDDWIGAEGPAKGDELPVLAGSSVHFDRGFLRVEVPEVAKTFSHRYYDVSALKLFCRSRGMPIQPKAEAHRALDDIKESIAHAKECATWLQRSTA